MRQAVAPSPEQTRTIRDLELKASPVMGGAWLAGVGVADAYESGLGMIDKAREQAVTEQEQERRKQELIRALEVAKKIQAAQAKQDKATQDRNE